MVAVDTLRVRTVVSSGAHMFRGGRPLVSDVPPSLESQSEGDFDSRELARFSCLAGAVSSPSVKLEIQYTYPHCMFNCFHPATFPVTREKILTALTVLCLLSPTVLLCIHLLDVVW